MKFSDIWDDQRHIVQGKTGGKLAIPLSLRLNAINWRLRDGIAHCCDSAVSNYLAHFFGPPQWRSGVSWSNQIQ